MQVRELKMQLKELQELLKTSYGDAYKIHKLLSDKNIVIIDHEKRAIVETRQTLSLDGDWVSHIDEFRTYEYYLEYANTKDKTLDCITFNFDDINVLYILDGLVKDKKRGIKND